LKGVVGMRPRQRCGLDIGSLVGCCCLFSASKAGGPQGGFIESPELKFLGIL
jgi:hypothetical protein